MPKPDDELRMITTDPSEVMGIVNELRVTGVFDTNDIYEIIKADGATEQLFLGDGLKGIADMVIQGLYPGCIATLISSGEEV